MKCKLCKEEAKYEDYDFGKPYCWKHLQVVETANECEECEQYKPLQDPYRWGKKLVCEDCLRKLASAAFNESE